LLSHSYLLTGKPDPLESITHFESFGRLAVATFFVISGYLVTSSLIRSATPAEYLKKRVLRIYPAFAVMVLVTLLVVGPLVTALEVNEYFSNPRTVSFLQNLSLYQLDGMLPGVFTENRYSTVNGSLWTLPAEFTVYVVLLCLFVLGLKKPNALLGAAFLCIFLCIGIPHLKYGEEAKFIGEKVVRWSKNYSLFFMGAFMYAARERIRPSLPIFLMALAAALSSAVFSGIPHAVYYLSWPYVVLCIAFMPVPLIGGLGRLGDISYGLYLYAFPVQQSVLHFCGRDIGPGKLTLYSLPIAALLGTLSWILIEKPVLRLKGLPMNRQAPNGGGTL